MSKGIKKHQEKDHRPTPVPTMDEVSPATWPENEDERELFIEWVNAVNHEYTCLGFRDWIKEVGEGDY